MAWLARLVGLYLFNYIKIRLARKATQLAIAKAESYLKDKTSTTTKKTK